MASWSVEEGRRAERRSADVVEVKALQGAHESAIIVSVVSASRKKHL